MTNLLWVLTKLRFTTKRLHSMALLTKKLQSSRKKSTTTRFWMPKTRLRIPFKPSWGKTPSHSTILKRIQILSINSRIWRNIPEESAIGAEDSVLRRSVSPVIWANFKDPQQRQVKSHNSGIEKELLEEKQKCKSHQTKWTTFQEKTSPLIRHQN